MDVDEHEWLYHSTFRNTSYNNMTGATSGAGTVYPSGVHNWILMRLAFLDL
jgi:hypothetical protein